MTRVFYPRNLAKLKSESMHFSESKGWRNDASKLVHVKTITCKIGSTLDVNVKINHYLYQSVGAVASKIFVTTTRSPRALAVRFKHVIYGKIVLSILWHRYHHSLEENQWKVRHMIWQNMCISSTFNIAIIPKCIFQIL